jgi:hypothetical protein
MGKPTPDERLIGVRFPIGPPTWISGLLAVGGGLLIPVIGRVRFSPDPPTIPR